MKNVVWYVVLVTSFISLLGLVWFYFKESAYSKTEDDLESDTEKEKIISEVKEKIALQVLKLEKELGKSLSWVEIENIEKEAIEDALLSFNKNHKKK